MDAINKLLGQNGHMTNGATQLGKKSDNFNVPVLNKTPGATGNDVAKSSGTSATHRINRKSLGKIEMSKYDYDNPEQQEHPQVVDETSFKTTIQPGKKGGTFSLPFCASITVPEGCFGKRDDLTCRVATPQTRWLTFPAHLTSNEQVNSEIFTLSAPFNQLKKNVTINIPFIPVNSEFSDINVKVKHTGHIDWVNVGFVVKEMDNKTYVELDVARLGTFLVTTTPKTETFLVTSQGCLHQARLSRHITVRFPKKAVLQDVQCSIQIIPISEEKVQLSREQNVTDLAHISAVSEFIDIFTNIDCHFARPVTLKIPLPVAGQHEAEGGGESVTHKGNQDIAVLSKTSTGWELVESQCKFTPNTVSFDTKEMARFCAVQCVPGRQKKMMEAITLLEGKSEREKGEICLFLSIKNKSWFGVIEVFPQSEAETKIRGRRSQGFTIVLREQARQAASFRSSNRRHPLLTKSTPLAEADEGFELHEGLTWQISIYGDVKVTTQSDLRENSQLRYFARLNESFRTFFFEPLDMDPRPLEACVSLVPIGIIDESVKGKLTFTFKIEVEESTMVEFLVPDSPSERVPQERKQEKLKELVRESEPATEAPKEDPTPLPPPTPKQKEVPTQVMRRLTQIKKPITVSERESRALTGRSLMALARLVPEGLTLAVHLQLPDSTITGIGFDALSNNLNMSDVSYKILLHWKRKCKDKQMDAIRQLTNALREMNYHVIADAIFNCHMNHKEFTRDAISQIEDDGIKSADFL